MNILSIDNDSLAQIFVWLSLNDKLHAAQVCKKWRIILQKPHFQLTFAKNLFSTLAQVLPLDKTVPQQHLYRDRCRQHVYYYAAQLNREGAVSQLTSKYGCKGVQQSLPVKMVADTVHFSVPLINLAADAEPALLAESIDLQTIWDKTAANFYRLRSVGHLKIQNTSSIDLQTCADIIAKVNQLLITIQNQENRKYDHTILTIRNPTTDPQ